MVESKSYLLVDLLLDAVNSPYGRLFIGIGSFIGAVAVVLRLINAVREYRDRSKSRQFAAVLASNAGIQSLSAEDVSAAVRFYVEPNCTQTDPSDEKDLRNVVALAPLFKTVESYFQSGGEKRHLLVLADSGMGKTSFCINYFVKEAGKGGKGSPIVIIPLGRGMHSRKFRRSRINEKR
ncbi:hypothetical protein [Arenimonas daejeonensis]|uniref:hypothetical protein n=1 Tax=Arenimonas daejeonensis TaxID=370777 RepID=UPI0011BF67B1|nr:hypothetical protein [Arenimonas daejeonensis]